jgi:hypothetical protein
MRHARWSTRPPASTYATLCATMTVTSIADQFTLKASTANVTEENKRAWAVGIVIGDSIHEFATPVQH